MAKEGLLVKAGGDINPSRFVTGNGSYTVVEANAADQKIVGISQEGTKVAPQTGASTLAAEDGDQLRIFTAGDICLLEMDASGCTAWDYLKPDNDGKGDVASSGDPVAALALETVSGGEKAHVIVLPPFDMG